jgi:preprotein translocase subunit SecG
MGGHVCECFPEELNTGKNSSNTAIRPQEQTLTLGGLALTTRTVGAAMVRVVCTLTTFFFFGALATVFIERAGSETVAGALAVLDVLVRAL